MEDWLRKEDGRAGWGGGKGGERRGVQGEAGEGKGGEGKGYSPRQHCTT